MSELHADVRDLLAALYEALDVPSPDITVADEKAHYELIERRAFDARIVIASLLKHDDVDPGATAQLREWTAARPVTYTPWQDPDEGNDSSGSIDDVYSASELYEMDQADEAQLDAEADEAGERP